MGWGILEKIKNRPGLEIYNKSFLKKGGGVCSTKPEMDASGEIKLISPPKKDENGDGGRREGNIHKCESM